MAGETNITIMGNLAEDPRPFVTQDGLHITNLVVLSTPSRFDRNTGQFVDEATNRFEVKGFRDLASHANVSLKKGMRVVVTGTVTTESWQDKESGQNRHKQVIVADDIAVSLRFGTAGFQRSAQAPQQQPQQQVPVAAAVPQAPQVPVAPQVPQVPAAPVAPAPGQVVPNAADLSF